MSDKGNTIDMDKLINTLCDSNKDKQDKIDSLECDLSIAENKIEELEDKMNEMTKDLKNIKGTVSIYDYEPPDDNYDNIKRIVDKY
eukprot:SAG22_NODE_6123_length_895_cov_2.951005_1_plen_86_part_00